MTEPTRNEEENKRYDIGVKITFLNGLKESISTNCIQNSDAKNLISEYDFAIDRLRKDLV